MILILCDSPVFQSHVHFISQSKEFDDCGLGLSCFERKGMKEQMVGERGQGWLDLGLTASK